MPQSKALAEVASQLFTIKDYIRWTYSQFNHHKLFYGHGTDNAWDEAVHLVLGSLHLPWDFEPSMLDARITHDEAIVILSYVEKRCLDRVPLAYLLGEAWFAGLPFNVDHRVLVPRSPLSEMIQNQFEPWLLEEPTHVLDLCTGSGCIGIATAYAFPYARVDLADISEDALNVARSNVERHYLDDQIKVYQSDLFNDLPKTQYDLILSNPPYVDQEDLDSMPDEFSHEPALGLGSGDDGLDITRRILAQAADYLSPNGVLICEVGNSEFALQESYPEVPFLWLEFEQGGQGVFMLTRDQLKEFEHLFKA
ncbi:[LSU ribosomal protein L3P]-glutamine N5-methyltransferase [Oceanospirillum multiglobuliferum]|uniref:50S ribosomal protein L3 N(5)-glutamine methyltransferase n=1 Tax=Oceanospirillum multiglobuliferum TaxID=64969 RepID=UPI0009D3545D|nr:50S ribosomal protein L3 N(5)-glutamine methyltransferase [Oceanospirillum multiglobuliferum]SJZ73134.1 [LSU ribosomal protein L3P]-glutamine N5-methyltransferase [Oceanospirillum multiglobuliferum]